MSETENINTSGETGNGKLHIFSTSDATKKINEINRDLVKQWNFKHFKIHEFDSPDFPASGLKMNFEMLRILEKMRDESGFPFIINSGYRTPSRNLLVGGKAGSSHLDGLAVDIKITDSKQRKKLIQVLENNKISRYGIAGTFIHVDIDFSKPQDVCFLYPDVKDFVC